MTDSDVHTWGLWFHRTHEVAAIGMAGAMWHLRHLPGPGGIGQQDAKLMAALDWYRQIANTLLRRAAQGDSTAELRSFHRRHQQPDR